MEYKGFKIEITNGQGNGNFLAPLTNVPYGYKISKNGRGVDSCFKMFSSEKSAREFAQCWINRATK